MTAKILVVDDESVTRRVVTYTLQAINVEVICAVDGMSALELAEDTHFDLALIDINLPDISGFDLLKSLRGMRSMQGVPMVIFTARNNPDDQMQAQELGASGFLYKPFSTQELRDLVQQHLEHL